MLIYLFAGLMLSFFNFSREGLVKSIQLHQSLLNKSRFNGMTASCNSKPLKKVFQKPLLRANADFARFVSNDYITMTKIEGVLSVLYRRKEALLSVQPANQPFFWMDTKSYLFHRQAQYTDGSVFLCPDIHGVFAPNFLISCTLEEYIQDFVKQDALVMPALKAVCQAHEIPDEIITKLYEKAKKDDEHICLTQIALHRSLAQKLLYSMINRYGNALMDNAVTRAIECRDMYMKNPLQYNHEHECRITLTRRQENFEHHLHVKHYFGDSVDKWLRELS